jgi:hypothetical protein
MHKTNVNSRVVLSLINLLKSLTSANKDKGRNSKNDRSQDTAGIFSLKFTVWGRDTKPMTTSVH